MPLSKSKVCSWDLCQDLSKLQSVHFSADRSSTLSLMAMTLYIEITLISVLLLGLQTPKGLVVPVLRGTENMNFAEIEKEINTLAKKAASGTISIDEMAGGTFTISNGGVYGSLISTPIINRPQCAILGMHSIVQRPMVVEGQVVPRPMTRS